MCQGNSLQQIWNYWKIIDICCGFARDTAFIGVDERYEILEKNSVIIVSQCVEQVKHVWNSIVSLSSAKSVKSERIAETLNYCDLIKCCLKYGFVLVDKNLADFTHILHDHILPEVTIFLKTNVLKNCDLRQLVGMTIIY